MDLRSESFCAISFCMEALLTHRGKRITQEDVVFIRRLIAQNPGDSRRKLSEKLCRAWNWRQSNGMLRAMVCRGLMLMLHRAGHIELPARRWEPVNPLVYRKKPAPVEIDPHPLEGPLSSILPLEIQRVRRTPLEKLCDGLIEQYHYLGYCQPVGEHLKYLVFAHQRPIACMIYSSAPRHIGCRDRFIGWPAAVCRKNIHFIAYQSRFLILPWVHVPCLASHLLGWIARLLPSDWEHIYRHPVYFQETFVDLERFKGTCYKASNWIFLGKTTGRGKNDQTNKPNRSIKAVWGYPLYRDFRARLCETRG
jgi:Druantia protein DruA